MGPDTGRTLLVRHRTKNKTTKRWFLSLVAKSPTKNIFFVGPDTGRTLLVRHRTKNKTTKRWFIFLVALVGLEPTLLAELDFESSASTNSATGPKPNATRLFCCCLACFNLFNQTRTAICFVCWFFCRFFCRTNFFINRLFNCRHFWGQARRRF